MRQIPNHPDIPQATEVDTFDEWEDPRIGRAEDGPDFDGDAADREADRHAEAMFGRV